MKVKKEKIQFDLIERERPGDPTSKVIKRTVVKGITYRRSKSDLSKTSVDVKKST